MKNSIATGPYYLGQLVKSLMLRVLVTFLVALRLLREIYTSRERPSLIITGQVERLVGGSIFVSFDCVAYVLKDVHLIQRIAVSQRSTIRQVNR